MNRTLTIKQYRELLQYTQKELADSLQISQAAYSQIENGYHRTSIENFQKIAVFFGIDIDYVMADCIPIFIYIYNKKRSLDNDDINDEIEFLLNEISEKIAKLVKNNSDLGI